MTPSELKETCNNQRQTCAPQRMPLSLGQLRTHEPLHPNRESVSTHPPPQTHCSALSLTAQSPSCPPRSLGTTSVTACVSRGTTSPSCQLSLYYIPPSTCLNSTHQTEATPEVHLDSLCPVLCSSAELGSLGIEERSWKFGALKGQHILGPRTYVKYQFQSPVLVCDQTDFPCD